MRFIKKTAAKIIHTLGFDFVRIPKDFNNPFLGLSRFPINTIIDIGANKGQFAKKALKAFPRARIYCFEPLPEALNELEELVKKENLGRVKTFNLALGNRESEVQMFHHLDHNDSSSLLKTTKLYENHYPVAKKQREISVHLTTLDRIAEKNQELSVPEILIKVDTEGYEKFVIEGGKETFKKARACILEICLDELHEGQPSFSDIFSLMNDLGFKYAGNLDQICAKDGHIIYINAVFKKI